MPEKRRSVVNGSKKTLDRKAAEFPHARKFQDYRKMFETMGKEIDAVTISTPEWP